jgi:hypothetical protein
MHNKFLDTIKGKKVFLATHWDCDGVTSGAILYHLIKDKCDITGTNSKGMVFRIDEKDIKSEYDVILVSDIHPGNLDKSKVIYFDHHPNENDYLLKIHNDTTQSCSLLIWQKIIFPLIKEKQITNKSEIKYYIFLTLLGFFGDGGKEDDIPIELYILAKEMIPDLMTTECSWGREYIKISKYVSLLNIGKRNFWNGNMPLELLKSTTDIEEIIYNTTPIGQKLSEIRKELGKLYSKNIDILKLNNIDMALIESDKNIQGVLCARHMSQKPILVLNRYNNYIIGSMRVPDHIDFNAGEFLNTLSSELNVLEGGGHEKAAGITIDKNDLSDFINALKKKDSEY